MTQLGIDHIKQIFVELGDIAKSIIKIVKSGPIGGLGEILALLKDAKDLIKEAPLAIPEMKDLDGKEVAELGQLALQLVLDIISSIKA